MLRFCTNDSLPEDKGLLSGCEFYEKIIEVHGTGLCTISPIVGGDRFDVTEKTAKELLDRRIDIRVYVERRDDDGEVRDCFDLVEY